MEKPPFQFGLKAVFVAIVGAALFFAALRYDPYRTSVAAFVIFYLWLFEVRKSPDA